MYSFANDYSETAPQQVLDQISELSSRQFVGYGCDDICQQAADLIRRQLGPVNADIHFLMGGTQTNMIALAAMLRPWDSVIAVDSGHINVHETGAVEGSGHKIEAVRAHKGKMIPEDVATVMDNLMVDHMTHPAAVFISDATETGTIYTLAELQALRQVCDKYHLYLYLDGARLGTALMAEGNDVTIADIAGLCDAFYIGGTKNGALFGEALVLVNDAIKPYFRYLLKQKGGMLAKGFVLGAQFKALFTDDLYFKLAAHADQMAMKLKAGLQAKGIDFNNDSPTNQQFPLLTDQQLAAIGSDFRVDPQGPCGNRQIIRLVCSWATEPAAVEALLARL